jgi:DNA (cytosine-5)-methyltransferase 1
MQRKIPIIDLFAGPGGLGEGFSAYSDPTVRFEIALSIEKEEAAHRTLELRSFIRKFGQDSFPSEYYDYITGGRISRSELFEQYPYESEAAYHEAWCAELGSRRFPAALIDARIRNALNGQENWVLIGGPPCQAYSLAGRSRMKGTNPDFESDKRHVLYREYLGIIARHRPSVFIMENVKGLLTSKHNGGFIFEKIRRDLGNPWGVRCSDGYDIYSLSKSTLDPLMLNPEDFLIEAEQYGIPQARHRVILLGVRRDWRHVRPYTLKKRTNPVSVRDVIADLPAIRSRLSRTSDSFSDWRAAQAELLKILDSDVNDSHAIRMLAKDALETDVPDSSGADFILGCSKPAALKAWYTDSKMPGVINHAARSHMGSDLCRYLFASCFARLNGRSPKLGEFPAPLLPAHKNIQNGAFEDRFRVQRADAPSTTIVSHIAKDGHYYIHPDPSQCRSLTVREVARLQTFPDNYFFEGNRTSQYTQVGNAVPPYLACQIAGIVAETMKSAVCSHKELAAVG